MQGAVNFLINKVHKGVHNRILALMDLGAVSDEVYDKALDGILNHMSTLVVLRVDLKTEVERKI